ncbi:MAG: 4Fe-4S dicluster domain-containing protein [Desulfatitalea sp.]|nr:4Fe-4S dicluster domain-containing protein [Desulfatitalea sp.]
MDRRTFLKTAGMGSVAFAAGCNAHPEKHLYTLVRAPEDMVTGEATWYATTCRECPAGCGVLAKNREGRVIKLEGNPLHPVNLGKLCARGQAALQGLYHTLSAWRGQSPVIFEPLAYEGLKGAYAQSFGQPMLPGHRLEQADFILSFGADFLETWLSPVEYSRKFKVMHAVKDGRKGLFIHVGPYQSLTAANADQWLMCRPGSEAVVALGLIQALLNQGAGKELPVPFRSALNQLSDGFGPAEVARQTDLAAADFQKLLYRLRKAQRPLVLPTATASQGAASAAADLASGLLNALLDPTFERLDFDQRHRVEIAHSRAAVRTFWQALAQGPAELLLLNNVNPLYSLPADSAVSAALARKELFKVAFTRSLDETAAAADLVIPVGHPLETWDAYESKQGLMSTLQPVLGKIGAAPGIGDFFLGLGAPQGGQPAGDYRSCLSRRLADRYDLRTETDWLRMIQNGGRFVADRAAARPSFGFDGAPVKALADLLDMAKRAAQGKNVLQVSASLRFYDGRGADYPWLAELPDMVTQVTWQTVALVHPTTMTTNGWSDGQRLQVATAHGQAEVPAYSYPGLHPSLVVIPMGQGHTHMGRYAQNQGVNPLILLGAATDAGAALPDYTAEITRLSSDGSRMALASVSGSRDQYKRRIALEARLGEPAAATSGEGLTIEDFPLTLPLPEGYDPHRDFYPAHEHQQYRWGMAVDLDRCIGCEACVAGCYAENNVGVVGQTQIVKGREMAWIRIERYEDPENPSRLIFLPMLCQHCDNAPCESVCPVYAPHHSKEGLNNQVYNRCIGTRFCAQNCPYKVRRFNWFEWQWPAPLNLQLNPDVTVRSKGVMEKCSFCVQRIKAAHNQAKNEQRAIRDGEVTPACAQTCPTDALLFGNLMDPDSALRKKIDDPRAYQILGYLNTKPAVIYLKKVVQVL